MKKLTVKTIIKKNRDVVQKELNGITYLMNPHDKTVHTLNETASFIWKSFNTPTSIQMIADKLTSEYKIDKHKALEDILDFVEMYIDHDMILAST